ncbi:MAG: TIR domain-containing protein, partial [Acidimicrobiales bacterium]
MTDPGTGGVVPQVVISYARADSTRVLEFVGLLEAAGIGAWVDHEDITGAQLWAGEIAEAIDDCSVVLFFASPRAIASQSVVRELALAFDGRKDILPLYLEELELPPAMRYQLAGVQRIELYEGTEAASRLPAVLRALERLGVVPAPAGTTPMPVTQAIQTGRSLTPTSAPATAGKVAGLPRRTALIAAIAAVVVAGIVGGISASGGDDDGGEGGFEVAAGDLLYVRLPGPFDFDTPAHLRSTPDAENDDNIITEYPLGTGLQATGAVEGSWVEVTASDDARGWVQSDDVAPASGVTDDRRSGLVESLGYRVVGDPIEGLEGLVILKGALDDDDLGHLELAFFFVDEHFIGVDGYPSHQIEFINPDTDNVGAAVTYHLFDGPGTGSPIDGDTGYPTTYFHARDGRVVPEPTD